MECHLILLVIKRELILIILSKPFMIEWKLRTRSFEFKSYMILFTSTTSDFSDQCFNLSCQSYQAMFWGGNSSKHTIN